MLFRRLVYFKFLKSPKYLGGQVSYPIVTVTLSIPGKQRGSVNEAKPREMCPRLLGLAELASQLGLLPLAFDTHHDAC